MARVTRSKKIDIAEDNTALAIRTSLPDAPGNQLQTLVEIHNPMGTFPIETEDERIASEIKGLKAAYKVAIGAAKRVKKSSKGKKKGKQGLEADLEVSLNDQENTISQHEQPAPSLVPEPTRQVLQGGEGRPRSLRNQCLSKSNTNLRRFPRWGNTVSEAVCANSTHDSPSIG
jgi:hypothetical protein